MLKVQWGTPLPAARAHAIKTGCAAAGRLPEPQPLSSAALFLSTWYSDHAATSTLSIQLPPRVSPRRLRPISQCIVPSVTLGAFISSGTYTCLAHFLIQQLGF